MYLENNNQVSCFTPQRLQVTTLLCTQATIAILNAKLYNELENRVAKQTVEVDQRISELQRSNMQLAREIKERM